MCVEYELDGKKIDYLPAAVEDQLKINQFTKLFQGGKLLLMELKISTHCLKMQKNIFML